MREKPLEITLIKTLMDHLLSAQHHFSSPALSAGTQAGRERRSFPSQVSRVPADGASENHLNEIWDVKREDKPLFSGTAGAQGHWQRAG